MDSVSIPYPEQIENIFEHVDLSEVTSSNGVLLEHGFPLFAIDYFKGTINDSNQTSMVGFSLAYASLFTMALDDIYRLPHPDSYRNICDTVRCNSSVIQVAVLHQNYTRIDPNALINNLFSKVDDQLFDVPGRPYSPYVIDSVFMVAPARNSIEGNVLSLAFNSNLVYCNTGQTVSNLFIDMDDGLGYQPTVFGTPITSFYDSSALKNIRFKVIYSDGEVFESHTVIFVEDAPDKSSDEFPYDIIDFSTTLTSSETYLGEPGVGKVYVSYACGHTSIQKPFIWAEGYNPKIALGGTLSLELGYEDAITRILDQNIEGKPLSEYLEDEGYDLIVLDYDDGGDYLERIALFILGMNFSANCQWTTDSISSRRQRTTRISH